MKHSPGSKLLFISSSSERFRLMKFLFLGRDSSAISLSLVHHQVQIVGF